MIPFLFLHGLGGSVEQVHSTWTTHPEFNLITMNQRGHGDTPCDFDSLDFDVLGDDAIAYLDRLGIEKALIGGISMGAAVSLNIATRYPHRVLGLLLIRNAWLDGPMEETRVKAFCDMGLGLKEAFKTGDAEKGFLFFQNLEGWKYVSGPSKYTRNAFTIPFAESASIKNWQKYLILPTKQPIKNMDCLKSISVPTYILACKDDFCHPFEYGVALHSAIPNSKFIEIPSKDENPTRHKEMINETIHLLSSVC